MNKWKYWRMFVIIGGVVGLCMIPILDVAVYWLINHTPAYYAHSPDLLIETLLTLAQIGMIVKYLLITVGLVGLIGWFLISDPSKERPQGVVV